MHSNTWNHLTLSIYVLLEIEQFDYLSVCKQMTDV